MPQEGHRLAQTHHGLGKPLLALGVATREPVAGLACRSLVDDAARRALRLGGLLAARHWQARPKWAKLLLVLGSTPLGSARKLLDAARVMQQRRAQCAAATVPGGLGFGVRPLLECLQRCRRVAIAALCKKISSGLRVSSQYPSSQAIHWRTCPSEKHATACFLLQAPLTCSHKAITQRKMLAGMAEPAADAPAAQDPPRRMLTSSGQLLGRLKWETG